jgi:hypothetical protein
LDIYSDPFTSLYSYSGLGFGLIYSNNTSYFSNFSSDPIAVPNHQIEFSTNLKGMGLPEQLW